MYVTECNILTTLAVGTNFRISSGHVVISIVLENGHGFKCPRAIFQRTDRQQRNPVMPAVAGNFRAFSSHKLYSLEAIYNFITFCNKRISVLR